MMKFKNFITESPRPQTHADIVALIATHKRAGEILNPVYKELYDRARRIFSADTEVVRELVLQQFGNGNRTPELHEFYYDWPTDSFASLNKAGRTLAKVKDPKAKNVVSAGNEVIRKWAPVAADLKALKAMVVKVTQKRAEAKVVAQNALERKKADSSSLIKIFESHMQEYIDAARKRASEFIQQKLDVLKKNQWNLDKVAPRPNSRMGSSTQYKLDKNMRDLYSSITKVVSDRNERPTIVQPNQVMIDRYIELAVRDAEAAYRGFMEKMINKIGKPVVAAQMTGNIWTNATLTVTTDDGEQQVWNTKMILNFSKYQKMFNQFPSRRKK